jgi:hypothetical protein
VGIFFVVPILAQVALPRNVAGLARFLPSNAGDALWGGTIGPQSMTPWSGFALLCCYAAALVAVASWRLRRGDALAGWERGLFGRVSCGQSCTVPAGQPEPASVTGGGRGRARRRRRRLAPGRAGGAC